jgi:hypothetical protein
MNDAERGICEAISAWLRAWQVWGAWAMLAAIGTVGVSTWAAGSANPGWAWAALAIGVVERGLALRLRFDQGLFRALAQGRLADTRALDGALAALRLRREPSSDRPLDARIAGVRRLLLWHAAAVASQTALLACVLATTLP